MRNTGQNPSTSSRPRIHLKLLIVFTALIQVTGFNAQADNLVPRNLAPSDFAGAKQPQVAVSPKGTIYVVFGREKAVYVTISTDHGNTFSPPVKVADVPNMPLGMRRGPRIAATDRRVLVTAPGGELVSFLSEDNGATWSQPMRVNDQAGSAREGLQNIAALPDGSFYAVWQDSRSGGGSQIEGARLDSGASSWGKNVTVYQSPDKSVCPCCHPSIVSDGKGKLVVMWRNALQGNRDFYLAESTDRGDTFSPGAKLGTGSWQLAACPMDGGNLIASPADGILTIWRRKNEVFIDKPGEPETRVASGLQPVVTRINSQIVFASQEGSNLVVRRSPENTSMATFPGSYASLAMSPDGREGYLVWEGASTPQFVVVR